MPITIENTTKVIEIPIFRLPKKKPAIEVRPTIKPEPEKPIMKKKPEKIRPIKKEKTTEQIANEIADFIKKKFI